MFLNWLATPWVSLLGCEGFLLHFGGVVFVHAEGPIGLPGGQAPSRVSVQVVSFDLDLVCMQVVHEDA